jgi:diacylglycerol kinase (ATP)
VPATAPRRALIVTFANSAQFGNGARIAPAARLDDGRLDMVVFEESSRFATVWALPRLFTGGVGRLRGITTEQIERATIESDVPMRFHVDGEPVQGGTRLEARVHPGALLVCVR